jgi:mannose-6-phosphate isomerase-like protein (cupin superfamily)
MLNQKGLAVPPSGGTVYNVIGALYRFVLTSAETEGAFALLEATVPAKATVPLHQHSREDETFYILEGTMQIECGGRTIKQGRNSTAFLPRNVPHSFTNPGETSAKMIIVITPGGFEKCLQELSKLPAGGPPPMENIIAIGSKYGLEFPAPKS